jgi:hypothetical protein
MAQKSFFKFFNKTWAYGLLGAVIRIGVLILLWRKIFVPLGLPEIHAYQVMGATWFWDLFTEWSGAESPTNGITSPEQALGVRVTIYLLWFALLAGLHYLYTLWGI